MKSGIKNFLYEAAAFLIPLLSTLVFVLILYLPRGNSYWNFLRQAPFYAGIYFWQSQRPDAFNFLSAFILGIFADVLGGVLLGINILSFLVLYLVSIYLSERFNIKRFSYSWLLFSAALFITMLFKGIITSLFFRQILPLNLLVIEFLLTLSIYPLLARAYIWVERRFIHLEERYEKIQS